jgi:signal transduction histidine kinase
VRNLLAALLLVIACPVQAQVQTFEQAEVLYEWRWTIPEDSAPWEPIALPHSIYLAPQRTNNRWYRIRFQFEYEPSQALPQSLYFPKLRLHNLNVHVNRQLVWRLTDSHAVGIGLNPLQVPIPPSLLLKGENIIHLEFEGSKQWFHGLSRAYIGSTLALAERAATHTLLQQKVIYILAAGFGAIGLLSLWLSFRSGRDPVLFWYGVSGAILLASTAAWHVNQWHPDWAWRLGILFMRYHGYLVPLFILHLRLAGRRHYWIESVLWILLIVAFRSIATGAVTAWVNWGIAFSVLPALFAVPLMLSPRLRAKPAVIFLVVADFAACLFSLHDWASRFGILAFDRPFFVYYAPAFAMLAAVVPILERVQASMRDTERQRLELERRVAENTREIEASHKMLRESQRAQTLAEERRRIMADMHDGLGSRLVALLSIAQSGKAHHGEISEGIAAALEELRLVVDSAQPVEGDVGVVLGSVRHRMRSVFERAGVQLVWNVSELPRMDDLTPERILAIQRIFLEAFSNAITHSVARTVSVFTMRVPGAVRIVIEDDGRGFDSTARGAGMGLANLQLRAKQAGGTLSVESQPGKGTRVTLSLPIAGEAPDSLPSSGQNTDDYPVRGIPVDTAPA